MITVWTILAHTIISTGLALIFYFHNSILLIWMGLELITWSIFFFFFLSYSKVHYNFLFIYFLIQTVRSFVWFLSVLLTKYLDEGRLLFWLLGALRLVVKMGLFPGHIWIYQIYSSTSMAIIVRLSTISKIAPSLLFFLWFNTRWSRSSILLVICWIALSYFIVIVNIRIRRTLFSFIFFSRVFHLRNMILIISIGFFTFFLIYLCRYISSVISFLVKYFTFSVYALGGEKKPEGSPLLVLYILSTVGFPPFPLFWLKLFVLYKLWGVGLSSRWMTFLIFVLSFAYLATLFLSIVKMRRYKAARGKKRESSFIPHIFLIILPSLPFRLLL